MSVQLIDLHPSAADFRADVVHGLTSVPKSIPPKYFYDTRGAALFEEITQLPEYYVTRTEMAIFEAHAREIAGALAQGSLLVEFGSGSARKIRLFFDRMTTLPDYMPIDLSKEQLFAVAAELANAYPAFNVIAVCADYTTIRAIPGGDHYARRVVFFPGSTIGNLDPPEVDSFFAQSRALLSPGDGMILGVDLKKKKAILDAAYDDAAGVTAEFNRNLLRRINAELDADFDPEKFEHVAFFDEARGRIEMHLRARRAMRVRVGDRFFDFMEGETIHTENSYKYSVEEMQAVASRCGFEPATVWTDEAKMFSVHWLVRR